MISYPLCKIWTKRTIYRLNIELQAILCFSIFNNFWKVKDKILVFNFQMNFNDEFVLIGINELFLSTVDFIFMLMLNCFISNERQAFFFKYFYPKSYLMLIIIFLTILTNQLRAFPGEQDELTLCWPAWQSAFIISILTYYLAWIVVGISR